MRNDDLEKEADLFALFLLMPTELFMREMLKKGSFDLTSNNDLKDICKTFGVTITAFTVRLKYLSKSNKRKLGLN